MTAIQISGFRLATPLRRTTAWIALCVSEMLLISLTHLLPVSVPNWQNPFFHFRTFGLWIIAAAVAFMMICWTDRQSLLAEWRAAQSSYDPRRPLALNLALFAALLAATAALAQQSRAGLTPGPFALLSYGVMALVAAASLLRIDIPISAMIAMVRQRKASAAAAVLAGLLVRLTSYAAQDSWEHLAGATLVVTRAILSLYERSIVVDVADRTIRIDDFQVEIGGNCSGYEGIALVAVFLSLYLWIFRRQLRFPHALLMLPAGIAAIWLLNAVRIAALVSIGAHLSPQVAVHGFHSQAGWIAFLGVTLAMMALAQRISAFATPGSQSAPVGTSDRILVGHLAPFIALMLTSTLMAAAAPDEKPLYAIKVAALAVALWRYRDVWRGLEWTIDPIAVLAGLCVGAAWIATDPDPTAGTGLGAWLAGQSMTAAAVWLMFRTLGSAVLVPLAEELAFRSFLYRWIVSRDFQQVRHSRWSLVALLISSTAFGILHDRWMAAAISGAVFALVMLRTGRLPSAVIAHATANGVICAWAIAWGQWSLL